MCPHCGKDAPVVYRGLSAYCTACGGARVPLTGKSVQLAGQPSKVGGVVAKVFGWLVLAGGLFISALIIAIIQAIAPQGVVGWVVGTPIGLITTAVALMLLFGGRKLSRSGEKTEAVTREQAIVAMAQNRAGMLGAIDVSRALDITLPEADEILTRMAKATPDTIAVDVDDHGQIAYRFREMRFEALADDPRFRVAPPQQAQHAQPMPQTQQQGVRVDQTARARIQAPADAASLYEEAEREAEEASPRARGAR